MKEHPDCLGIYISLNELYVAQTSKKDGSVVLESLVRVPINGVDRAQLRPLDLNEAFFAQDNWREALGKVTSKKKWKTKNVVVSLAPAFCLLRHFIIPTVIERKMWKSSIPLQARKYIHFPFDKAEYAYHVYEFETATTKQKRLGVVFTMTTKNIIDRLKRGFKSVGLELITVEPAAISLSRSFNDGDKEAVGSSGRIYSFFGKEMASFVFLNENAPALMREVETAGSSPSEFRHFELTNSTEFISKQLEKDPFEEAVISGRHAAEWIPALEADAKKPVRLWNLKEVYGIETRAVGEVAAIGASIKFHDSKTPDMDFTKGTRLSAYEFNASLTLWKLVVVVILVMLGLIGKGYMGTLDTAKELKQRKMSAGEVIPEFKGLSGNQIKSNLDQMQKQNSNLENMVKYDRMVTPLLVDIMNSVPDGVWFTNISFNDKYPPTDKDVRTIAIRGNIKTGKGGQADLAVGNKFKETFANMPNLAPICRGAADIGYSTIAGSGNERNAAKDTAFTLTCGDDGE